MQRADNSDTQADRLPRKILDLENPEYYVNRELSLLEFQRRVLEEAQDDDNPLLERLKFLSIVGSNMDEFFMVRVGGLKMQLAAGNMGMSPDGSTPAEQIAAIRKVSKELMDKAQECLQQELIPELARNGIFILNYDELSEKQRRHADSFFERQIFPVLTPMGFDPGHPFPHISNLSLNLAVLIRDEQNQTHFARIKVPRTIPRLVPIKRSSGSRRKDGTVPYRHYFVWVEQLIAAHLSSLFHGKEILEAHPFRVTRNADFVIRELEADDLLATMEQSIRQRRFGQVVRLTLDRTMPAHIRAILIDNLDLEEGDAFVLDGPLGHSGLFGIYNDVERADLRDQPFKPTIPLVLLPDGGDQDMFTAIRRGSILMHQPYDSFDPVIAFLETAAKDPHVLAIKQTLYRVERNSPVLKALLLAREKGKQVTALVELKARFDEQSNIGWAKMLEREGVHVIYGLLGLKTHSKIALVVRREGDTIRRYVHLGTGNYNAMTARLYEDLGYLTADEDIGADATDLFNFLTGYSSKKSYRRLIVAPFALRNQLNLLIEREIAHQREHGNGRLILKTNSLVDPQIIRLLYRASQENVKIDLIVRGICCLRPGIEGLSQNITVTSIVGRFLEHSRLYYFFNGGDEEVFLGSADLMPRNIDRRVEIVFPVREQHFIRYLHDEVLQAYLRDHVKARYMMRDGAYVRPSGEAGASDLASQEWLLARRSLNQEQKTY